MAGERIDGAARLFALVSALLYADGRKLTKEQLFRVVEPYAIRQREGNSETSLEQMFTRDKDILRTNGFDLEANRETQGDVYSIAPGNVNFPEGTQLTPHQLRLIAIASDVWNRGKFGSDVSLAALRLRGLGLTAESETTLAISPRIATHEPVFLTLSEAVASGFTVEFSYRKPGQNAIERRRVRPWRLRNISSQWLLQCWDEGRGEPRNFLLKRIVSKVKFVTNENGPVKFQKPSSDQLEQAKIDLDALIADNVAELSIRNHSEAWYRFVEASTDSAPWVTQKMNFMDAHVLAEDLREYGADVKVLSPDSLIQAVRHGLEAVEATHA